MKWEINGKVLRAEDGLLKPRKVRIRKIYRDVKNQLI